MSSLSDFATPTASIPIDLPPMPYPGLRSFEAREWPIFFGRESMIEDVRERLLRDRLVVVHGSSGCGKSSLVRAGVMPRLVLDYERHGLPSWRTATMRPGGAPLWNLAQALVALIGPSADDHARFDSIRKVRQILNRAARRSAKSRKRSASSETTTSAC